MKTLYWDSDDPLDCFDNPNCRWGDPCYRLEPGDPGYVVWFPPGYTPPEPKAKPRRTSRHATFTAAENPEPNTAMSFQYVIIPNTPGAARPFRARAKLGSTVEQDELLAAVAADSAIARADVEKVIQSLSKVTVGFMRQTRPLAHVLDLFRAVPSVSGSFLTNEPSADEVKAGVGFTLVVGPDAQAAMLDGLTVEKVGEAGVMKPEVENITLSPGGTPNAYSLTAGMKCSGDHFRGSGPNQAWPTAYLLDASLANPIPVTVLMCSQTEMLIGPAPAGTTGLKRLKLVAGWDSDITFIYPTPLTLV